MKKKMIIAVVFVAALALTASAVFARVQRPSNNCCDSRDKNKQECCPSVDINADTDTKIINDINVKADSGDNSISGQKNYRQPKTMGMNFVMSVYNPSRATIETGKASAVNDVRTYVEGALVEVKAPRSGSVDVDADTDTFVKNEVDVKADSGDNSIRTSGSRAKIDTGEGYADNYTDTKVLGATVKVY